MSCLCFLSQWTSLYISAYFLEEQSSLFPLSVSSTRPLNRHAGIADGSGVPYVSILALNVRTEIAYGLAPPKPFPSDGCTALSIFNPSGTSYLAQNWDWQAEQQENLIHLNIHQQGKPSLGLVTEAGIIGKIGLNDRGVGVGLNAIRAAGVDFTRVPVHLALRAALECRSREAAVSLLKTAGVASSCHILIADAIGGEGVECSSRDVVTLPMDARGVVEHTNHYLGQHEEGVEDLMALKDSPVRLSRLDHLLKERLEGKSEVEAEDIWSLLQDEDNYPTAISRSGKGDDTVATLFSIVLDLTERRGEVIVGRPSLEGGERFWIDPSQGQRRR